MNGIETLIDQLTQLDEYEFVTVVEGARSRRVADRPPTPDKPEAITRDGLAAWYAARHMDFEPTIREVVYLPGDAPANEIRLLEVNVLSGIPADAPLEALDFGVDRDLAGKHELFVADITPGQWDGIRAGTLPLPEGWTLEGSQTFGRRR